MRWLLLWLAPWLVGAWAVIAVRGQLAWPLNYPWPCLATIGVFLVVAVVMAWRRIPFLLALKQLAPAVLAMVAVSAGLLMVEGVWQIYAAIAAFAITPLVVLELLFLSIYDPARYPVNGLSRVNLALVIVMAYYASFALSGLITFLTDIHWLRWTAPPAFGVMCGLAALVTAHPNATPQEIRRWTLIGLLVGCQAGFLAALMPIAMTAVGVCVMLLLAVPLRIRRYAYQPVPGERAGWMEGVLASLLFVATLVIARWS